MNEQITVTAQTAKGAEFEMELDVQFEIADFGEAPSRHCPGTGMEFEIEQVRVVIDQNIRHGQVVKSRPLARYWYPRIEDQILEILGEKAGQFKRDRIQGDREFWS